MAAAGFYLVSTPDSVRCFVCLKELDGWEPEDDPIEEHRNHSKKCPFLKIIKSLLNDIQIQVSNYRFLKCVKLHRTFILFL